MKILFVSMELPYPDHSGGSKYAWQKIRQLSEENELFLVSFNEFNERIQIKEYEKYTKESYFYSRKKKWLNIVMQFYKPYSLTSRINIDMQEEIKKLVQYKNIDAIVLDSIHMYYNIERVRNIPIFLTQQNIEYKLFESISKKVKNPIKKIIYWLESIKLRRLEENLYKKKIFKGYIFISYQDLEEYEKKIGKINAICVPPTFENISLNEEKKTEKGSIVFTGKMNYEPNVTAVKWFVEKIFPFIQKEIPEAKFYVVGKNPTEELKQYANDHIIVTGEVDDTFEYLKKAQIVVIPLLSGGGVKLKLFDAISTNNIVITTNKGIEGTCLKDQVDLYVANNSEVFIRRCIENLKEPNKTIAKQAKKTLQLNYGFSNLQERLQKFIERSC